MNKYFPLLPQNKIDHLSIASILLAQGYAVSFNWSKNMTFPKETGKGAAKGFYPVIGIAVMERDTFIAFQKEVSLTDRFKDDSWFANLSIGTYEELKRAVEYGPRKREEVIEETLPDQPFLF